MHKFLAGFFTLLFVVMTTVGTYGFLYPEYVEEYTLAGSGYMAQQACLGVFVGGRPLEAVVAGEQSTHFLLRLLQAHADEAGQSVTASYFGVWPSTAVYRGKTQGCVLGGSKNGFNGRSAPSGAAPAAAAPAAAAAPFHLETMERASAAAADAGVRVRAQRAVVDLVNSDSPAATFAAVVVHRGVVIAEAYSDAAGVAVGTPLPGWSMTKSVANALVGLRVADGKLATSAAVVGDVTVDHLLQMTANLDVAERYDAASDVFRMLYGSRDVAQYGLQCAAAGRPGARFGYSSVYTNLLSHALRRSFGGDDEAYWLYPYTRLFDRIGANSAVLSTDAAGNFVLSSYCSATARDWARFGQLYLNGGTWRGERVLDADWVATAHAETSASGARYGRHFWLARGGEHAWAAAVLPPDAYYMHGFNGQVVAVVPSADLVVVRLGLAPSGSTWHPERFFRLVLNAVLNEHKD